MNTTERDECRSAINDSSWLARHAIWKIAGLVIIISLIGFVIRMLFLPAALVTRVTDPDKMIANYEEFQELFNTCQKLDADLRTICQTPTDDAMFAQFSKGAMVATKRQQMTRWVNDYNGKSKMITRKFWKSGQLPYQLNEEDFANYNCK